MLLLVCLHNILQTYSTTAGYWKSEANRKQFFCDFARENNLDHLEPTHWYLVTKDSLLAKVALLTNSLINNATGCWRIIGLL